MQNPQQPMCPPRFDFSVYLNGRAPDEQKARLEQHLCVCEDCFETLITVLNQDLNQPGAAASDSVELQQI